MATIVFGAVNGNWNDDTKWVGGVKPTAADDAQLVLASGNCTIDAAAVCRSLDCNTYTGILTHNAFDLSIGDGTAGAGNIALRLVAGMTYTVSNSDLSQIIFLSTSTTQQTIDWGGKTSGDIEFNGVGGSWIFSSAHTGRQVIVTRGTFNANGQACNWFEFKATSGNTKTITLGAANITITGSSIPWDLASGGTTFTANTAAITFTGTSPTMQGPAFTFGGTVSFTGAGSPIINAAFNFANFTRTGTAAKTDGLTLNTGITVTAVLTLTGNSRINQLLIKSNTIGTARTITNSGATMTISNTDFQDITVGTAWDASARTDIGDCGGNTNITFPASATQTATGTSSFTWSTHGWTSRVPLPQDDVVINNAFSASQTITADMPRLGRSINFTGATGTPAWTNTIAQSIFGSITLISGMTITGTNTLTLAGRSSYSLTSAAKQYTQAVSIIAPSGTYTLNDAFSTAGAFTLTNGGFTAVTFNVTALTVSSSNSNTRSLTLGTGTWTLTSTSTATVWNLATTTGLTFSGASSIITISTTSTNTRTFSGGGLTYGTLTYTVAGSTGKLTLIESNTFSVLNFSDVTNARTLEFTAGTTTTIVNTNGFNVQGTSGKLMTIQSATASSHTLSSANQQSCDYLSISRSTAQGGGSVVCWRQFN